MNMILVLEMNIEMKINLVLDMSIEMLPEVHGDANTVVGGQLVHVTKVQLLKRNQIVNIGTINWICLCTQFLATLVALHSIQLSWLVSGSLKRSLD